MVGNANANGIPFLKRYGIPPAIKNSMILWYDIARQGATNESMAENPVLKDLSGNGHDATCNNFAWRGMSGIGGYAISNIESVIHPNESANTSVTYDNNIITCLSLTGNATSIGRAVLYSRIINFDSRTIKFNGGNYGLIVKQTGEVGVNPVVIANIAPGEDNIVTVDEDLYNNGHKLLMFGPNTIVPANTSWYFKQLPLYPNALVFDGEDDYALAEGLPLLNKEDGYTVISRRKWIKGLDVKHCLVSKNTRWEDEANGGVDGAFAVECDISNTMSFGISTRINVNLEDVDDFVYQTSKSYNGKQTIVFGDKQDTNHLCIAGINKSSIWSSSIAVYSLILFNRDLSTEEIEWVKTNLIPISTNE